MSLPPRSGLLLAAVVGLMVPWGRATPGEAGVVVISNRTDAKVHFEVARDGDPPQPHSLEPRELVPIPVLTSAVLAFDSEGTRRRHRVDTNSVCYFLTRNQKVELAKLAFPSPADAEVPPPAGRIRIDSVGTIPVMILVDDDEPAVQPVWEKRLRDRLAEASDVFEHHCRIRFEVVAVGTWVSSSRISDFAGSLREFERKVTPTPARLAIGFTSQYRITRGQTHLGGTRGALGTHVLIRESSRQVSTIERLEILIHELGHFLGATHSVEADSVMRPTIGDHRSNALDFRIGFDPPNTLLMNLLCEEVRTRRVRSPAQVRPATKALMRDVYAALGRLMPKDECAKNLAELLEQPSSAQPEQTRHPSSLVEATRTVVHAIAAAAHENRPAATAGTGAPLSGDRLTDLYVRRAAAAADRLPSDHAAKAFLLGLGVALDRSDLLRTSPILGDLCERIESNRQRRDRLAALGEPTMRGRSDLTEHFAVSAALTAVAGSDAAETVGITKELDDSRRGTGFSFADLSADMAGARFASDVGSRKIRLSTLAERFTVEDYVPEPGDLEEGISLGEFLTQYQSAQGNRFQRQRAAIRERILALPGYRGSAAPSQSPGQ